MRQKKLRASRWIELAIKILCILLLLLIPFNINAVSNVDPVPTQDQINTLEYWPPVIHQYESLYAQKPNDPNVSMALANAYNNYGVLLARNKQWSDAIGYMEQALKLAPNPATIRTNISNVYYEQGRDLFQNQSNLNTYTAQNAMQLATQALSYNQNNVNAYLLIGDIEYMSQNMPEAERAWKKAAQLLPNNADVQRRLAQISRETSAETDMSSVFNARFNIRVDSSVASNPNFDINAIMDNAYNKVAPDFGYLQHEKIPVVVYNRQEYESTMVDAPSWSEAAYDGKIRLAIRPDQKDFNRVMSDVVHEYSHVLILKLAKNKCPRWFNEGIAKYEEFKHGLPPRIYLLAMAYNTNNIIDWNKIDQALVSKNSQEALLAYQQSFSFVYYLVQRYGMYKIVDSLKLVGNTGDFPAAIQQVYGVSLESLQKSWRVWLTDFITNWANVPARDTATDQVDYD